MRLLSMAMECQGLFPQATESLSSKSFHCSLLLPQAATWRHVLLTQNSFQTEAFGQGHKLQGRFKAAWRRKGRTKGFDPRWSLRATTCTSETTRLIAASCQKFPEGSCSGCPTHGCTTQTRHVGEPIGYGANTDGMNLKSSVPTKPKSLETQL